MAPRKQFGTSSSKKHYLVDSSLTQLGKFAYLWLNHDELLMFSVVSDSTSSNNELSNATSAKQEQSSHTNEDDLDGSKIGIITKKSNKRKKLGVAF